MQTRHAGSGHTILIYIFSPIEETALLMYVSVRGVFPQNVQEKKNWEIRK